MKTFIKPLSQPHRIQIIEDDRQVLDKIFDANWEKIKSTIERPGFQKGKVPRSVAEKQIGVEKLYATGIREVLNLGIQHAKLDVYSIDDVVIDWYTDKTPLMVIALCTLQPKVVKCEYKQVIVNRQELQVSPEEIDANLKRLAYGESEFKPSEEPLDDAKFAIADFVMYPKGAFDEEPLGKQQNYKFKPTQKMYGFEHLLVRTKAVASDKPLVFEHDIPEEFFNAELRGKRVQTTVTLKQVLTHVVPEVDDALAKKIGFDSLDHMVRQITDDMKAEKRRASELIYKDEVLSAVIGKTEFTPIPDDMVKTELNHIFANHLHEQNRTNNTKITEQQVLDRLGVTQEQWQLQNWARGLRKVQMGLVLDYIVDAEGLIVSAAEEQQEIQTMFPDKPNNMQINMHDLRVYLLRRKAQSLIENLSIKNQSKGQHVAS